MKTEYTPEPWRIGTPPPNGEQTIGNEKGLMVAVATTGHGVSAEANARRIVACVNACAGIPDEQLYDQEPGCLLAAMTEQEQEIMTITNQRDRLLAAIALAMPVMDAHAGPSRLADFHAAIASVKEKA